MLVSAAARVTAGMVQPGAVRVVVARRRAFVPGCPNWHAPSQPDWDNKTMSNFGCGVNSNLAAMVANPEDLIHGREGTGVGDPMTGAKAVQFYPRTPPTAEKGLHSLTTKNDSNF